MRTQTVRNIPVHKIAYEVLASLTPDAVLENNPGITLADVKAVCDWIGDQIGQDKTSCLCLSHLGNWDVKWTEDEDEIDDAYRRSAPTAEAAAIDYVRIGAKDGSLQSGDVVEVDVRPAGSSEPWQTFAIKATCQWGYEILNQPNEITKGDQEPSQVDSVAPEEGIRLLNTLTMSRRGLNPEDAHREADAILLAVLCGLGATSVAAAFRYARDEIGFWYA